MKAPSKHLLIVFLLCACTSVPEDRSEPVSAPRAPMTEVAPVPAPRTAPPPATSVDPTPAAPPTLPAPVADPSAPATEVVFVRRATGLTLEAAFEAELAAAEAKQQRAVVMFTADWCTPCRSIKEALESNPIVQEHTRGGRFLIIDVDEWRGPAQRLIEGADPSKLPLLVAVNRQGEAQVVTHGSKIGLLDPHTTGQNLARVLHGQEIVLPSYQDDPKRRRDLAIADSRRQKSLVEDRTPVTLKVQGRQRLADGQERLTVDLTIHNNEAGRRYWILPTYAAPPPGPVEVPSLSGSRFEEHVRAGFFTYGTDPPTHVIASGNWGSVELLGYTVEVPRGTTELQVHKLNGVTVAGEKLRFTKKVPYALKIKDASKLVAGRTLNEPRTIELDVKKTYALSVAP